MKKFRILIVLLLLVLLCACMGFPTGVVASPSEPRTSYTLAREEIKDFYTTSDFLALYQAHVSHNTEVIEVTELNIGLMPLVTYVSAHETVSRMTSDPAYWQQADCQVFKELKTFTTYVLRKGRMFELGVGFGGMGVESIESFSLSGGKTADALLFTYSWGSGLHRSHIGYYDFQTEKEYTFPVSYPNADCTLQRTETAFKLYSTYPMEEGQFDEPNLVLLGKIAVKDRVPLLDDTSGKGTNG